VEFNYFLHMNQQPDIADDNDIIVFASDKDTPIESLTARAIEVLEAFAKDSNMNSSL